MAKTFDFSGYATKSGLKCSDGRTILKDAFKHQDGHTVPLVWAHIHNDPSNVLGHAVLENRDDGVYCYGYFNDGEMGKQAKELVKHGDITSLSIYANQLKEKSKQVIHGAIREVSLVLSGANPGALIENLGFAHGDDGEFESDDSEAIIYTGLSLAHEEAEKEETSETTEDSSQEEPITHSEESTETTTEDSGSSAETPTKTPPETPPETSESTTEENLAHAESSGTVEEMFNTLNEDQKQLVYSLITAAIANPEMATVKHSNDEGDSTMKSNAFDQTNDAAAKNVLTHDQMSTIVMDAKRFGSLKESFMAHAVDYGFNPIDVLFPDARDVAAGGPTTIKRDTAWVTEVLNNTSHTPFSRIRTRHADITADEARAKGYVTGSLKKEEVITLMKRSTTPTTIYKKQKLDRDDILDITDFDVVVWLKAEMRGMLDEEIARAVLISDGRSAADEDKINELNIRPIAFDDPNVYVERVQVADNETVANIIKAIIRSRKKYKGSGNPALFIGNDLLTDMLLIEDTTGRRLYNTVTELASVLRVSKIVEVELMDTAKRVSGEDEYPILGIIVNLKDYTIGADKGGQVSMFDDFDIDYNQQKYLIETRISGALTQPKSAIVIEKLPAVG